MSGRILPDLRQVVVPLRPAVTKGRRDRFDRALICSMYLEGKPISTIARRAGCSPQTVMNYVDKAGLPRRGQGSPGLAKPRGKARKTKARHDSHVVAEKPAQILAIDHPAVAGRRTVYPSTVISPSDHPRCLIGGENNRKIGGVVQKGPLKGFPIFTLALEERATCPTSCRHWRSCYCNRLHLLKRFEHGAELERVLPLEIGGLMRRNPGGILIRLHISGDFYSVDYVRLWERLLEEQPNLHVFGFTARIESRDPICRELIRLVSTKWPRFAMRFSNAYVDELATVSIEHPLQKPDDAVICPAQQGRAESCSTCALCWHGKTNIAFLQH